MTWWQIHGQLTKNNSNNFFYLWFFIAIWIKTHKKICKLWNWMSWFRQYSCRKRHFCEYVLFIRWRKTETAKDWPGKAFFYIELSNASVVRVGKPQSSIPIVVVFKPCFMLSHTWAISNRVLWDRNRSFLSAVTARSTHDHSDQVVRLSRPTIIFRNSMSFIDIVKALNLSHKIFSLNALPDCAMPLLEPVCWCSAWLLIDTGWSNTIP